MTALSGAENWTLRQIDMKYFYSFAILCWRRMEKTSWTDRVKYGEVLHKANKERNILHTVERKKVKCRHFIIQLMHKYVIRRNN